MTDFAKIENLEGYVKDLRTGAIVLQDRNIEKKMNLEREKIEKEMKARNEIVELRKEVQEIKELLKRLINNG